MFRIVVYYFEWVEKISDVIQREEAIFDASMYWWENGNLMLELKNGHRLILPRDRYVQIMTMKEQKTIQEEIENARKSEQ